MGLFNRLFGQNKASEDTPVSIPVPACSTEQELLEEFAGIALEKQLAFQEIIGSNAWNVDVQQGIIAFGPQLRFSMQILGTVSHGSKSWLWAWANVQSALPPGIIQQSLQMKAYGETNGIDLLRNDSFGFTKEELHILGSIASGMFGSLAYYIADYGQGAMLVTINGTSSADNPSAVHLRILTVFPQVINQFDVNHRNAFSRYASHKGYAITEDETTVTVRKNDQQLTAKFDNLSRLTSLKG